MMKVVKTVTPQGIEYTDENGIPQIIEFEICYINWLRDNRDEETNINLVQEVGIRRIVGVRDICANPPYIEFFTEPAVRFEFKTPEEGFHELRRKIEKAGWRTSDLS